MFWREAESALVMQDLWFRFLLTSDDHHLLVATDPDGRVVGFLIAQVMDAPPVYDPGGRTCMVDDFVAEPGEASDGLLAAARSWAVTRGAVQMVVVTAAADEAKRSALAANDLAVASGVVGRPRVTRPIDRRVRSSDEHIERDRGTLRRWPRTPSTSGPPLAPDT